MNQYSRRDFLSKSLKATAGLIAISMIPVGFSKLFSNNEIDGINSQNSGGIALPIPQKGRGKWIMVETNARLIKSKSF